MKSIRSAQAVQAVMIPPDHTPGIPGIFPASRAAEFTGEKRSPSRPAVSVTPLLPARLCRTLRVPQLLDLILRWQELFGLLPLAPVLIYQISYMNCFCPITEGWFSGYASLIRAGAVPYRDFALLLPPLYPLFIACVQVVFGTALLPLHWLGLLITSLIGFALYLLLRAHFPIGVAGVATAVGLVYYQSGNAFIGYDFTQILTLFLLLAALTLDRVFALSITHSLPSTTVQWRTVAAGIFLALATFTKHSNAGVCSLFLIGSLAVVFARFVGFRRSLTQLLWLGLGLFLPFSLVLAWLATNGILRDFFAQVLFDAAGAKGGVWTSLTQWIPVCFNESYLTQSYRIGNAAARQLAVTLVVVCGIAVVFRSIGFRTGGLSQIFLLRPEDQQQRNLYSLALAAYATLTLGAVIFSVRYDDPSAYSINVWRGRRIYELAIPAAVNLYALGGTIALGLFLWRPTLQRGRVLLLFALGVGLTWGNGTSSGLSEISSFLGVGLISALLLRAGLPYVLPTLIPMTAVIAFVTFLVNQKYENPYHWWTIMSQDIRNTESQQIGGILAGLSMPPEKCTAIQTITNATVCHSNPGEAIYVFPHMPLFYLLADRPPFRNAVVSWFDFMSDRQAEQVARSLDDSPPAVIIFCRLSEEVLRTHETSFRGGRRMAQRQIVEVINCLVESGRMKLIAQVDNLDGVPVNVYGRGDSAKKR